MSFESLSTAPPTNRLDRIDLLRGIAALTVVLFHYTAKFPDFYPQARSAFSFSYGFYGVHLFFMISGFVILMSLHRRNGDGFIKSRFIRLYPVFWASVLTTCAVLFFNRTIPFEASGVDIVVNLTMLQGFLKIAPVDGVYWSLTFELGFYAMMYGIFRMGLQNRIVWVPVWMAAGAAIFPLIKGIIPHPLHFLLGVNSYAHLFAAGLAIYLMRERGFTFASVLVLGAVPLIQWRNDGIVGGIAVALSIAAMLWATRPSPALPRVAIPFIWLGAISYSLYLTHQMVGYVAMSELQAAGMSAGASLALTLIGALALASALTYGIEKPASRLLKDKLKLPEWIRMKQARLS